MFTDHHNGDHSVLNPLPPYSYSVIRTIFFIWFCSFVSFEQAHCNHIKSLLRNHEFYYWIFCSFFSRANQICMRSFSAWRNRRNAGIWILQYSVVCRDCIHNVIDSRNREKKNSTSVFRSAFFHFHTNRWKMQMKESISCESVWFSIYLFSQFVISFFFVSRLSGDRLWTIQ